MASASYEISGNQLFQPIAMEGKNKEGGYKKQGWIQEATAVETTRFSNQTFDKSLDP